MKSASAWLIRWFFRYSKCRRGGMNFRLHLGSSCKCVQTALVEGNTCLHTGHGIGWLGAVSKASWAMVATETYSSSSKEAHSKLSSTSFPVVLESIELEGGTVSIVYDDIGVRGGNSPSLSNSAAHNLFLPPHLNDLCKPLDQSCHTWNHLKFCQLGGLLNSLIFWILLAGGEVSN